MKTINSSLFGNKKLRDFLLLLHEEIEFNETNDGDIKEIGIKYNKLKAVLDDDDEISKYLKYSEKKEFIKLKFISKQQIRDKKIPNETYISKITPDHTAIKADDFYAVKRHYKINFYPEDLFVFEYNEHNIQEINKFCGQLKKDSDEAKLNLDEFSAENLIRIRGVLKIILDEVELQSLHTISCNKILLKKFEKDGLYYEDVETILNRINSEEGEIFEIRNKEVESIMGSIAKSITNPSLAEEQRGAFIRSFVNELENKLKEIDKEKKPREFSVIIDLITSSMIAFEMSEAELKNTLLLKINGQTGLKTIRAIKDSIDETLRKRGEPLISKKKKTPETTLLLNQVGDLYREPKNRYCYPMGEKSNRHRIIRFLATHQGYQLTEFISTELSIESEKTIRTEIGKMRNNIDKYLKIDGKDFLQGKKESGYRINPKYKITLKNE